MRPPPTGGHTPAYRRVSPDVPARPPKWGTELSPAVPWRRREWTGGKAVGILGASPGKPFARPDAGAVETRLFAWRTL